MQGRPVLDVGLRSWPLVLPQCHVTHDNGLHVELGDLIDERVL